MFAENLITINRKLACSIPDFYAKQEPMQMTNFNPLMPSKSPSNITVISNEFIASQPGQRQQKRVEIG